MASSDMLEKLGAPYGTFHEILHDWAVDRPDQPAIRDDAMELDWREMVSR